MGKKILIIEDEPDQILMLQTRLEASGYDVTSALDGGEGIKKAYDEKPDLIFLDMIMPNIGGLKVCKTLKANPDTKGIPIILFTASGEKDLEKECLAAGAACLVRKPYDSALLIGKVKELLKEEGPK